MQDLKKHKECVIAWLEGKQIQYRTPEGTWFDIPIPGWQDDYEYRIKHATKKGTYRVAFFKDADNEYTTTAETELDERGFQAQPSFVKWLTDWIEYEVE
jgi:hypothetical protein